MLTMLNQQEVARGGNKAYGRPTTGVRQKGTFCLLIIHLALVSFTLIKSV